MSPVTVLIGFAESLAAPECCWSLLDAGFRVTAFTRRGRRSALQACREVELVPMTPPEQDVQAALGDLQDCFESKRPSVVLPMDDAALWLTARATTPGLLVAGATGDQAELALNKSRQVASAREAGFCVPETRVVKTAEEALSHDRFPCILKSSPACEEFQGRLVRPSPRICADSDELKKAVESWPCRSPILIQPIISGTGEGLFGFVGPEGPAAWSAHRRVRMMNPAGSGSSACRSRLPDAESRSAAGRFLEGSRWRGIFMIESLRDAQGQSWFMELNGRPWGSMALARRSGLEYPAWAVQAALAPEFRPPQVPVGTDPPAIVCRHLGREIVHLLMTLRGPRTRALRSRWPSRLGTLRQLLRFGRDQRWYNYRPGQSRVLMRDTYVTVREALAGR